MTQTQALPARATSPAGRPRRPVRSPASRHGPVPRPDGPGTQRPGSHAAERTRRRGPLASPSGKTLTRYCQAVTEPGRRPLPADAAEAMQQAAEAAIAALKRPASLRILTNRCPNLGAAAKAALGAGHEVSVFHARGDTMGQQGRDAYAAGKRYLVGWPSRARLHPGRVETQGGGMAFAAH